MDFAGVATLLGVPLAILTALFTISGDRSRLRRFERVSSIAEKLPAGPVRERAEELQLLLLNQMIEGEKPESLASLEKQWRWRLPTGFALFFGGYAGMAFAVIQIVTSRRSLTTFDFDWLVLLGLASITCVMVGLLWFTQAARMQRAWRSARADLTRQELESSGASIGAEARSVVLAGPADARPKRRSLRSLKNR